MLVNVKGRHQEVDLTELPTNWFMACYAISSRIYPENYQKPHQKGTGVETYHLYYRFVTNSFFFESFCHYWFTARINDEYYFLLGPGLLAWDRFSPFPVVLILLLYSVSIVISLWGATTLESSFKFAFIISMILKIIQKGSQFFRCSLT